MIKNTACIIFLCLISGSSFAAGELLISKSVFAQLAEPETLKFQENEFAYFPAGTRLYKGDRQKDYRGTKRQLVFSENGIAAYIKQGLYWTPENIESLRREGGENWVFVARPIDVIAKISENVKLVIGFSRGEKYPLVEETEDSFVIKVGNDKIPGLGESVNYQVNIPRKNGNLVNLVKALTLEESAIFKLSVVDGISGIKKPCNTETAIAKKYGGSASASAGLSLDKFWVFLTAKGEIHASTETSKLEQFPKDSNISREYYTRNTQSGVYKLTRNKSCSGNQGINFIYTNPEIEEITISEEWANNSDLSTDKRTKQIFISCPKQYFNYFDELTEWNFEPSEIPFVISKTAKFKSLSTPGCITP